MEVRSAPDGGEISMPEQRRAVIECAYGNFAASDLHGAHCRIECETAVYAGGRGGSGQDGRSRHGVAGAVAARERSPDAGCLPGGTDAAVAGRVSRKISTNV